MTDWDQLREVGHRVSPPPFDSLVATADQRDRRGRIAIGVAALGLLAAVGFGVGMVNGENRVGQPANDPSDSVPSPGQETLPAGVIALPELEDADEVIALPAGRYRVALGETLSYDVDVPSGTEANNRGLYLAIHGAVLKVEAAGAAYGLPADPCSAFGGLVPAGPTVADLVSAIRDQPIYRVSRAEPVRIGDASGQFLEVRIPSGYDASSCSGDQVGLPGNPGTNNNMAPGYVGHWWILDVEGQRAVLQTFCDACGSKGSDFVAAMVESITFTAVP